MTQMPPDAQKSDDGNYWWDGSQWQPVQGAAAAGADAAAGAAAGAAGAAPSEEQMKSEIAQLTSEEQIQEHHKPWLEVSLDRSADDLAEAEPSAVLQEETA
jgi:hypothetical protein